MNLIALRSRLLTSIVAYFRRPIPRLIAVNGIHAFLFAVSGVAAFLIRFDLSMPESQRRNLILALASWIPIKLIAFRIAQIDRIAWRFVSLQDLWRLIWVSCVASGLSALEIIAFIHRGFPRSLYILDLILTIVLLGGTRLLTRTLLEVPRTIRQESQKVFIYGAGAAGVALLREIRQNPSLKYQISGFIDDNPSKSGMSIQGTRVLGTGADLARIAAKRGVQLILIAAPSVSGADLARILSHCANAQLTFRTVPSVSDMVNGPSRPLLRDVAVEDLLGRTPVRIDHALVGAKLQNQTVLVTGAAGSIGSELCRQIARFKPKVLIGFDSAETALFHVEQEMRHSFKDVQFEPVIGSVQHLNRLVEVFDQYKPNLVFHAAAYKHVPMMEANIFEAAENNIIGTFNVATAASRARSCEFVMISSDKAVRPTSIMGLTKRVAEIIVRSMVEGSGKFVSVRFGNVLGSNGSVIPIFRQQIAQGGPVTVTHPEMRRYFMTIPEAAQLVLQASAMGQGREIFVLDMGEQVKIVDLARSLILLSGLRPDQDIKIEFTGVRPGEKLYEELKSMDEETRPTYHEKIRIFAAQDYIHDLDRWIGDIQRMCATRDLRLILELKELVADYSPSSSVLECLLANHTRLRELQERVRTQKLSPHSPVQLVAQDARVAAAAIGKH